MGVKVPAADANGTPPDVMLSLIMPRDHYVDLLPFFKRDKIDLGQFVFVDPYCQYRGGLCAMPFQLGLRGVFFYNQSLFQQDGVPLPPGQANAFQTGRIGMLQTNAGFVSSLESTVSPAQFKWEVMPTPKAPATGTATPTLFDNPHAVSKRPDRSGDQTDAAVAFLPFLSSAEVMDLVAEARSSIPVHRKDLTGARYLRRPPESWGLLPKLLDTARYRLLFDGWREVDAAVVKELAPAWAGTIGVAAALENAQRAGAAALQPFLR
jgi:ABC-type glycerol-3-phosphate transport system substrate-binding protein